MSEKNWNILTLVTGAGIFAFPLLAIFIFGKTSNGFDPMNIHTSIRIIVMIMMGISSFLFTLSIVRKETGGKVKFMTYVWTILVIVVLLTFLFFVRSIRGG